MFEDAVKAFRMIRSKIVANGRKRLNRHAKCSNQVWNYIYEELKEGIIKERFSRRIVGHQLHPYTTMQQSALFELEATAKNRILVKTNNLHAVHLKQFSLEEESIDDVIQEISQVLQHYHLEIRESKNSFDHAHERAFHIFFRMEDLNSE